MAEWRGSEGTDGIRMSWNMWPGSETETCGVPTAVIYTPLFATTKSKSQVPLFPYSPIRCKECRATLNPLCHADLRSDTKVWGCPLCLHRNHFPLGYQSPDTPMEMHPLCSTAEYQQSYNPSPFTSSVLLFVVDTCLLEDELRALTHSLSRALALLPDTARIGFITFGKLVRVHELGFPHIPKSYAFLSSPSVLPTHSILHRLGLSRPDGEPLSSQGLSRFFPPLPDCHFLLNTILEEAERDPWPASAGERPARCTGTALSVAAGLLGGCFPAVGGARIMAFLGGPGTEGAGLVVSKALAEHVRSHKDIDKRVATHFFDAIQFYKGLAKQLVNHGHVLDLFAGALDQVGMAEMKVVLETTGGIVVLSESFKHPVFKDSFRRIFEENNFDTHLSSNGIFEVICSKDVKIKGVLGPCCSVEKKSTLCSDKVIGEGNTTAWKFCGFDKYTSLCILFDVQSTDTLEPEKYSRKNLYFQFLTYYQHENGQMRLRSTTFSRQRIAGPGSKEDLIIGFDQEAAAAVLARLALFKIANEQLFDAVGWLDRMLICLSSKFGTYEKHKPSSFSLPVQYAILPQLIYNLRHSQFIQVFNYSPDETAYFTLILNRENVSNSVLMIRPSLLSYSLHALPEIVALNVSSIVADRILLFDSYFTVVIFHGTTIVQWRNAGYQHQEEHKAFAQLLQAPQDDANRIIKERFPVPRLVVCDQHGSQARFLLARLNPSSMYTDTQQTIYTNDVSLSTFIEHLQKHAVQ